MVLHCELCILCIIHCIQMYYKKRTTSYETVSILDGSLYISNQDHQ